MLNSKANLLNKVLFIPKLPIMITQMLYLRSFISSVLLTLVSCVIFLFLGDVEAATVTPHRAFYEMRLGTADKNSFVKVVNGRSAFTLDRGCNGWRSNEDYLIEFGNTDGGVSRILSHFESWESDKGDMYSFDVNEQSSFKPGQEFTGYAQIKKNGGSAHFSLDSSAEIALPIDTYFPIQHLNAVLDKAAQGETILSASVFTGAQPKDALLATNTVIGIWKDEVGDKIMGNFGQEGYWPIQTAYFKPDANRAVPEYEILYSMQPNGIVRHYVIDYGDFTVIADLLKLETVPDKPNCN